MLLKHCTFGNICASQLGCKTSWDVFDTSGSNVKAINFYVKLGKSRPHERGCTKLRLLRASEEIVIERRAGNSEK